MPDVDHVVPDFEGGFDTRRAGGAIERNGFVVENLRGADLNQQRRQTFEVGEEGGGKRRLGDLPLQVVIRHGLQVLRTHHRIEVELCPVGRRRASEVGPGREANPGGGHRQALVT